MQFQYEIIPKSVIYVGILIWKNFMLPAYW